MLCDRVRRARPLLGTLVEISLTGTGEEDLHGSADCAFAQIERIHQSMSAHSTHSDVFRINSAPAGSVVPVAESTWQVIELAMDISNASDGVFDITVGAAMRARGRLPALTQRVPDADATFRDIELLPDNSVRVHRALAIDLGGIAKGYAVDAAVDVLVRSGVSAGCVNAGGDLRAFGKEKITVQVRDPLQPSIARAQVRVQGCALATSANYASDNGFSAAGVVLDPRCGDPVVAGRSGSVRASRCAVADALAKCMLMLGDASAPLLTRYRADGFLLDGDAQLVFDAPVDEAGQPAASQSGLAGRGATRAQLEAGAVGQQLKVRMS
jgi:thiamine biosynthesis lipoprotein